MPAVASFDVADGHQDCSLLEGTGDNKTAKQCTTPHNPPPPYGSRASTVPERHEIGDLRTLGAWLVDEDGVLEPSSPSQGNSLPQSQPRSGDGRSGNAMEPPGATPR